jgi:hypothetical protein
MTRKHPSRRPSSFPELPPAAALPVLALAAACFSVSSEPIEIKPIHITMDINLRVQRELEHFFDFEKAPPAAATPATQPDKE